MKSLYVKKSAFTSFLAFTVLHLVQAQSSSIYFDLDACNAILNTGDQMDYSEFTPQINNSTCADLEVLGGYLYRNNPQVNKHSCTPGVNGALAMCIGSNPACNFTPAADEALRIDLMLSPDSTGSATLSELSFYEKAPTEYVWITGATGPNNYPTLFGVRILKNGVEVFLSTNIATELTWNLNTFSFSGPAFTVSEPTLFNIELLPYCPIGNGEPVSAWDIDEITIVANCCDAPDGGTLTGGPFEFCVGDGVPDHVSGIVLTGQTGENTQWVITNDANVILGLPASPDSVNFDGAGQGMCLIWNISYGDGLSGLIVGNNLLTDLAGCFGLSNSLTVIRNQPEGGTLTGGPFEFCVGDGIPDYVSGFVLSGNTGPNSQWVITNDSNMILLLPVSLDSISFDDAGQGVCLIWNISYFGTLAGLTQGNNLLTDVIGCFDLSNSITVIRNQPLGGSLAGGPFEFCVGDSIPDYVSGVVLSGNFGSSSQWVITDEFITILGLPASLDSVNFDGAGQGMCLIWNISYFYTLEGLVPGNNLVSDVTGCFDLSNPITVIRNQPEGGTLTGGPFEFCVGDGIPDYVSGVVLSDDSGQNSQWVITNDVNMILGLPPSLDSVNFDGAGQGMCLIWNISYFDTLTGLIPGNNLFTDVMGCFDLSNAVTVIRNQPEGGTLTGGPFEFCVGDGIPDFVSGIVLTGNTGPNSQWVITNDSNMILGLPTSLDSVNFDGAGQGVCLIWNISYFDTITGLVPGNNLLTDVMGCFDLSNSISVNRNQPEGGNLIGGPFEFCAGDSITDVTSIILTGNVGPNSQWIVTNDINIIIGLPGNLAEVDFGGNGPGVYFIWNISYFDTLSGLVVGNNLFEEVTGCSGISDSVIVVLNQPAGGTLTGGPFEFCVGDGIPDHVSGIVLSGENGENSQWVITNADNIILGLPVSPDSVNFDGAGAGMCLIWHVSYDNDISGLEVGNNLFTDLVGCFGISNPLTVIRNQPEGGALTGGPFEFCVGDSMTDVTGILLSGNVGANSQWIVINESNIIVSLPDSLGQINFEGSGPGTFLIVNISYFDTLSGLMIGNNLIEDVSGCLAISDSVIVTLNQPVGGELTGGPFEFCVGDSTADFVSGIVLTGEVGANSQYVITDSLYTILSLPTSPGDVNFNDAPPGTCFILHVSYDGPLTGLEIGNNLLTDLEGCFSLSNALTVVRLDCVGLQGDPIFELKISPNPVKDVMTLQILYTGDDTPVVQVFDAGGRLCFRQRQNSHSDMSIDMNNFAEGCYFIRVQCALGNKTTSIVVVK
ncbi:MAG: T9SS type A sorting domain-containing protein [Saprospiraceae bacterium]